ncbi:MAG: complex I 24 kDa subunit family protein [Janthinobacterium lividum]
MKKRAISQGAPFNFNDENLHNATILVDRYPTGRQASAVVPLLDLAQRQCQGWLPQEAIEYVAKYLSLSFMQVYEVATFYSMFNLAPVGKYFLQVCTTTPCQLSGAKNTLDICQKITGTSLGDISPDGLFSVIEVECLGACIKAPVIQINDRYYENMDIEKTTQLLTNLKSGKETLDDDINFKMTVSTAGSNTSIPQSKDLSEALTHET